ncbi:MAG: hypothetical protein GY796_24605 [Chloroflexi bacterium]|nr:hypothetical protein [Chloroflexota bacterium]
MIEARGTKPDQRLAASFRRMFQNGTDYLPGELMKARLTSKELKIKNKKANIAGLQLADMLAHHKC